jgi:hypothetical protein
MAEEKEGADWLFPQAEKQKAALEEKGLVWAQKYLVFKMDPRARELLAFWAAEIENRDLPPNASHAEYAYWEGRRAFVRGIQRQIVFAENGLNQPKPRTT